MIIKVRVKCFLNNEEVFSATNEVEVNSSWYTAQNYFDESEYKKLMMQEYYDGVVIQWQNKNYVFKRKLDGDQRHKEGRKKRTPRHQQTS